ncbi:arabinan endo-1,5-alpha-L-arabinosidase [Bowmanella denitrificans]|uniref:arabinan endo-1,5-alpha-L-arabinosidase n=1 Tax=Bowmanella denitrificans TaxID=366582 RepID=UPI000C9BA362
MKQRTKLAGAMLLAWGLGACATAKQVEVHDPVMAKEGDTYYVFSTGPGITYYESKDLKHWTLTGRVFEHEPSWARRIAPGFNGHLWAPDIYHKDGKYYLYYSVSAFGKNTSGIGVTVNSTLDPDSPDYRWVDQGIVLQSVPNRDHWNAIDPAIIEDDEGNTWMSFGSFWEGLKLVKLDPSLTRLAEPQQWHSIAKRPGNPLTPDTDAGEGAVEAPFIFKKGDYYYLFVSFDKCCRGMDSDYKIMVGRSKTVSGPYLDKNGKSLLEGGGSLVLKGNEDWVALGHNSAYSFDGKDYLVFHAYETADNALQKLRILPISWLEGWPEVDPADLNSLSTVLSVDR